MINTLLEKAINSRISLFDSPHESALRLFNGFSEGDPSLALDIYARTLIIHNYADDPTANQSQIQEVIDQTRASLNWLRAGILKTRNGRTQEEKKGTLIFGEKSDTTSKGKVDLENDSTRLINKVRPLINDGGTLIAINNALYMSGQEYMQTLDGLCKDGYLSIRELIPVPDDFIGLNPAGQPITDPTPFNHSTKIAILDVRRK